MPAPIAIEHWEKLKSMLGISFKIYLKRINYDNGVFPKKDLKYLYYNTGLYILKSQKNKYIFII